MKYFLQWLRWTLNLTCTWGNKKSWLSCCLLIKCLLYPQNRNLWQWLMLQSLPTTWSQWWRRKSETLKRGRYNKLGDLRGVCSDWIMIIMKLKMKWKLNLLALCFTSVSHSLSLSVPSQSMNRSLSLIRSMMKNSNRVSKLIYPPRPGIGVG